MMVIKAFFYKRKLIFIIFEYNKAVFSLSLSENKFILICVTACGSINKCLNQPFFQKKNGFSSNIVDFSLIVIIKPKMN